MSQLAAAIGKFGRLNTSQMKSLLSKGFSKKRIRSISDAGEKSYRGSANTAFQAPGAAANFVTQRSPFQAVGGALSGAGDKMIQSGNPFLIGAGAVFKFAGELTQAVDKLHAWGHQLEQSNFQFAEFSSSMAQVEANRSIEKMGIAQEHGEARADSAQRLSDAMTQLERNTAPIEDLWANFQNNFASELLESVSKILEWLHLKGDEDEKDEVAIDASEFYLALGAQEREAKENRPKRLGGK